LSHFCCVPYIVLGSSFELCLVRWHLRVIPARNTIVYSKNTNDCQWLTISNQRFYEDAIDSTSTQLNYCVSLMSHWLPYRAFDFLVLLMINHRWRSEVYLLYFIIQGAISHLSMPLNVNTFVNIVIESSFALMKFMQVLINVYLTHSFNCWR